MRLKRFISKSPLYIYTIRPIRIILIPFLAKLKAFTAIIVDKKIALFINNRTYVGDGFITSHYVPWQVNDRFSLAYDSSFELVPPKFKTLRDTMWRAHIVNTCINWVQDVEGDIVELGTWYGILAQTILQNDNLSREKKLFLVDAFGQPGFKMSGRHKLNSYQVDIFDVVQERFKKSAQVHLVRGIVPEVLRNIPTNKVCFLMIDMNSGIPEQKGLEFFWDKLTVGAIVYFDDYGQNFPELRQLIDEFLVGKKEKLLVFPTGQAILQKM